MYSFHHVALTVSDLAQLVAFYGLIGFKKVGGWKPEDSSLKIVNLRVGNMLLELFCDPTSKPLPEHGQNLEHDLQVRGTKHFGLKVVSIAAAKQDVLAKGLHVVYEAMRDNSNLASYFFIKDPDGILVEIIEDNRG